MPRKEDVERARSLIEYMRESGDHPEVAGDVVALERLVDEVAPRPNPESLPDEIRRKLVGREVADVSYAIVDSKLDTVTLHFSGGYSLEMVADQLTFRWRR